MRIRITLTGQTPLLMHNDRLVDPLDPHTRELKRLTSIRNPSDEVLEERYRAEFVGALRWSEANGPHLLGTQIHKSVVEAARLSKGGRSVERGLIMLPESVEVPLHYDGPVDPDDLWKEGFFYRCSVGIGKKRVMRTRPRFRQWGADADFELLPDILNPDALADYAATAGRVIGVGDGRIIGFGRYAAEVAEA